MFACLNLCGPDLVGFSVTIQDISRSSLALQNITNMNILLELIEDLVWFFVTLNQFSRLLMVINCLIKPNLESIHCISWPLLAGLDSTGHLLSLKKQQQHSKTNNL